MSRTDLLASRPGRTLRIAAVAVAVFAVAATALAWSAYNDRVASAFHDAQLRARGAAADVDGFIRSQWWTLYAIASASPIRNGDLAGMRAFFDTLEPGKIGLDAGMSFIDTRGMMLVRNQYDGPPIDFSDREHVRRILATHEPVVSSGFIGTVNKVPIVALNVPVTGPDGTFRGIIGSGIRLTALSIGADQLRYAGGTEVVIVDQRGQVIGGAHPVDKLVPVAADFPLDEVRSRGDGSIEAAVGPYGERDQLVGFATAPSSGWTVLVPTPAAAVFGVARTMFAVQLAAIFAAAALAIGLLLWAARRLDAAAAAERRTMAELQVAIQGLERRQALSDAFVGVMSHELRTPVTTIYGGLKVLSRDPRRPELEEILEDMDMEAERLQRITSDLLVLSRAEYGLVQVHPEPVLVQRVLPDILAELRRRFPGVQVEQSLEINLPAASADSDVLRQVLDNLLTNAAKYGAGSVVSVGATRTEELLRITVSDGGPGVGPGEHERLFDLFYRSPATARRTSGMGIGLFVVRELVQAMGGHVSAEPVEPHGLRIVVCLPLYDVDSLLASEDAEPGRAVERQATLATSS